MHVCMMHVSMIIDPHACVFDACMMRLKFCVGRTNGQGDSRSWMAHGFSSKGKLLVVLALVKIADP